MILVAPPQTPNGDNPLRYVLLCDGTSFVLNIDEAIEAQKTGQVDFIPWCDVDMEDQARALAALRQETALEERMTQFREAVANAA